MTLLYKLENQEPESRTFLIVFVWKQGESQLCRLRLNRNPFTYGSLKHNNISLPPDSTPVIMTESKLNNCDQSAQNQSEVGKLSFKILGKNFMKGIFVWISFKDREFVYPSSFLEFRNTIQYDLSIAKLIQIVILIYLF